MEKFDHFVLELILQVYWNAAFSALLIKDKSFSRIFTLTFLNGAQVLQAPF